MREEEETVECEEGEIIGAKNRSTVIVCRISQIYFNPGENFLLDSTKDFSFFIFLPSELADYTLAKWISFESPSSASSFRFCFFNLIFRFYVF